ncbi:beta-galactosidase [Pacificoceanicola onchidii]|uniref:beta-galactosidase n=1 Tax=Pacificoceanicola onchidii TaxID=2562685 RepID=UPI0010A5F870|nr:beta-galactosidase [Pacificoceanicola onchidii]
MKRTLGTCYYPEHWPRETWEDDARRMAEAGLTWVRIGEFAWSRLEPTPGDYQFDWLDDAISILGKHGLRVVLGTPTATPPRWMLDKHPDMIALDEHGRPRGFGSRRHYCFSHEGYRAECAKIVTLLAERYGKNPHVAAWQTDNEYGCHDTILSYSDAARDAFQTWLRARYPGTNNAGDIAALNAAWGNVFWSMEYGDFDEIALPNLTVTEPNPAHVMDYRRFASDQVVTFNRLQTDIIRQHSGAPIAHNYMGKITEFDHYKVGDDLEIASWDSYPLGFLEDRITAPDTYKRTYAQQGDPDFQAFHHDLYRAVGKGRWWIMEQQPGPVNWAPYNPSPLPGMVRLWTWEAFAHGAEAVCYFRWRQAPFAQEQMHAGLLRPDSADAPAIHEAREVFSELENAPEAQAAQAPVALVFDYEADWMWRIQPQGQGLDGFDLAFHTYRALRRLGLSIDILRPGADVRGYKAVFAPGVMHLPEDWKQSLCASDALTVFGPRTAARTADFAIPTPLPPALPGLDVTVSRVETIRPDMPRPLHGGGAAQLYVEELDGTAEVILSTQEGASILMASDSNAYLGGWLDDEAMIRMAEWACARAGIETVLLPKGVRRRSDGAHTFWFNHLPQETQVGDLALPPISVTRT